MIDYSLRSIVGVGMVTLGVYKLIRRRRAGLPLINSARWRAELDAEVLRPEPGELWWVWIAIGSVQLLFEAQ